MFYLFPNISYLILQLKVCESDGMGPVGFLKVCSKVFQVLMGGPLILNTASHGKKV